MTLEEEFKVRFRSSIHKARINLYVTNSFLLERFEQSLKSAGITGPQFNILRILRGQETRMLSISGIKERMLDKSSDVSRLVDKLVVKKLVERKENQNDRRLKDISINQNGLDLLTSIDNCEKAMDDYLKMLSDDEVETLNRILDKIHYQKN